MAIIPEDDDVRLGLRGQWGDVVFRYVYGKTVMSRKPGKQDPAKQSEARRKTRSTFKEAAAWAMMIRRDPEKKAYYQQLAKQWGLTNDYIAAIRDYMRNPGIAVQYHAVVEHSRVEEPVERTPSVPTESRRADVQPPRRRNRDAAPSRGRRDTPSRPWEKHYHRAMKPKRTVTRDDITSPRERVQSRCRSPIPHEWT